MNPYAIYRLPSYASTYIDGTFPQHHWPFEHARQRIGAAMHDAFNPYVGVPAHTPRTDVLETIKKIYLDVELPGVKSKQDVTLTWTNSSTLLLEANIQRPEIKLDEDEIEKEPGDKGSANKESSNDSAVHLLRKERHLGKAARAFTFFVDVDTETMKATLVNGILYIILEKRPHEQLKAKKVEVVVE